MEEWIYLLLGLGWVVISAVVSSKKKKNNKTIRDYSDNSPEVFEDETKTIFEGLEDFFNKTETLGEKTTYIEPIKGDQNISKIPQNTSQNVKKTTSDRILTKNFQKKSLDNVFENQEVEEEKAFNLREAIIFSEILRTPYID